MATYNILGSCICRDAFGFRENNKHEVLTFLQATSALTWFHYNDKPSRMMDLDFYNDVEGLSNFQKRCLVHDYNKTVLEQFTKKADYFITDMTEFASMNIARETDKENHQHYFTFSKWFNTAYKNGAREKLESSIKRINHLDIIDEELIEKTIDNYVKWILDKGYTSEQVILIENKRAYMYTDGELLFCFDGKEYRDKLNKLLDKIYYCFKKKMPAAYAIKMPAGILCDKNHKWGLTDLHFCKEYYDYLYECIDMISKKDNCKDDIQKVCDKYSEIFLEKRNVFMHNSFEYADGVQLLRGKISSRLEMNYIAPKGIAFYQDKLCTKEKGHLSRYFNVIEHNRNYAKILSADDIYYVNKDDVLKGNIGDGKIICNMWRTVNGSTVVEVKENSIVIGHNGAKSTAQMNVIQTIENSCELAGKVITFSVYARVLAHNNQNKGGAIAFINANDYNKGVFMAKTDFDNSEWKRISVTAQVPAGESFGGLTICMRALAASEVGQKSALVEFSDPKLEVGTFPTKYTESKELF